MPALPSLTSWPQTFTPEAVGPSFDHGVSVVVVPAGPAAPSLDQATAALEAALRASGKPQLVMDSRALGPVGDLADAQIVTRANFLPVTHVVVVRVFAGAHEASAVITVYDKHGGAITALSGTEGTPLQPRTGGSGGVAVSRAQEVTADPRPAAHVGDAPASAQEEFERQAIYFEDFRTLGVNQYGAVVSSRDWSRAFQGKPGRPLDGARFYDALGKPELARRYRLVDAANGTWASAGIAVGTITFVVGAAMLGLKKAQDSFLPAMGVMVVGPLVGLGLGLGARQNPDLVPLAQKRQMVDEYNAALKRRLNLALVPTPGGAELMLAFAY